MVTTAVFLHENRRANSEHNRDTMTGVKRAELELFHDRKMDE
jgi:hypothetical protein